MTTTTISHLSRPLPQNLYDWPRLIYPQNPRPPSDNDLPLSDEVLGRYLAYNASLGPIVTDDVLKVQKAIDQAHFDNRHSSLAGQRCVIIDGPPMTGKTHAALSVAFRETRTVWEAVGQVDAMSHRQIPWIYTEVTGASRGFGLLSGMHDFCGLPQGSRDTAADLLARMRKMAPKIGLRGVVIDDSQGIAGGRKRESAMLADLLKSLITGLPATVVIIGPDLARSGVLEGPAGEQVRYRSIWTDLGGWPLLWKTGEPGPWHRLAATLTRHLAFPRGAGQCELNRKSTMTALVEGSGRRPGLAIEWVKAAANHAIVHDGQLDAHALAYTHRTAVKRTVTQ